MDSFQIERKTLMTCVNRFFGGLLAHKKLHRDLLFMKAQPIV